MSVPSTDICFCTAPMSYEAARVRLHEMCTRAGLISANQRITAYGMRKWTATQFANCGFIGYDQARKAMGHAANTSTLEQVYDQSLQTK
jgi:integrase